MNKYNNLLMRISEDYAIRKGKSEDQNQWKARLIYSLLGRMALASLFDIDEEETSSVIHMKRRVETLLINYRDMYPELDRFLPIDPTELSNEIYDIYLHSGIVYHEPNRVQMATKSETTVTGVRFIRGYEIETKQKMSGLGAYVQADSVSQQGSLTDMFQLEVSSLAEIWNYTIKRAVWSDFKAETNVEYLRMDPPFNRGYWVDKPYTNGRISLLRTGFKGSQLYYLYKVEEAALLVSQLPQWQVEDYNYRLLANACLHNEEVLPPSVVKHDGELVSLNFRYLPPPAELYLWKLYTWPETMGTLPKDFNRICTRNVFDAIKMEMQTKGYSFIEE